MSNILKLQKLPVAILELNAVANSSGSSTCVGVSCSSNGCVEEEKEECGCDN